MKAHQRVIRERHALELDPLIDEKCRAATFDNAVVAEIDRETAKTVILKYEWLGNLGTAEYFFGLYFKDFLAGVVCFGRTAGTKTAASVCGVEHARLVQVLTRGACVHWAHPHSASYLIRQACRLMTEKGYRIFVAYSDPDAGEIGTVYQAGNWNYCGETSKSSLFVWAGKVTEPHGTGLTRRISLCKDGKARDERLIHSMTRIRTNGDGAYERLCSRARLKERLIDEGFIFYRGSRKGRYVTFTGDRREMRRLRSCLKWAVEPYPKRQRRVHQ